MPSFQAPTSVGANANMSFNGNRPGHNLYLLDGGENYDRGSGGTSSIAPSIDAIAETQTLTSNYSAEYGLSSGRDDQLGGKSGTKVFHFSLWEFFRNNDLDARNYFNPAAAAVGRTPLQPIRLQRGRSGNVREVVQPEQEQDLLLLQHGMAQPDSGADPNVNRSRGSLLRWRFLYGRIQPFAAARPRGLPGIGGDSGRVCRCRPGAQRLHGRRS